MPMTKPKPKSIRIEPPVATVPPPAPKPARIARTPRKLPDPLGRASAPPASSPALQPQLPPVTPAATTTRALVAPMGKQGHVLTLLLRPAGATIAEMMAVTGWMSHSVRGLLSAGIKRKLGLAVFSSIEAERGRVYRTAPLAPVSPSHPAPTRDGAGPSSLDGTGTTRVRTKRTSRRAAAAGAGDAPRSGG